MTTINQLSVSEVLSNGDLIALFDSSTGDAKKAGLSALLGYIAENLTYPNVTYQRQSASVQASGYTIYVNETTNWVWLFITQTADYAAGTIVLPAEPEDQQELIIKFSHKVTTITVNGNGKTVVKSWSGIGDAGYLVGLKYDETTESWYSM